MSAPARRSVDGVRLAAGALAVLLALLALRVAFDSLAWRMELDTPLLHYMAFMVAEQGAVPYRDIFVTSFPGAILFHLVALEVFGHGDGPFIALHLVWTAALAVVTFAILRRFGWIVALAGVALSTLGYLAGGPTMVLQRDFVLVLFVALALLVHTSERGSDALRAGAIGVCFALAASVKPHAGIGFPLVLVAEWMRAREREGRPPELVRPAVAAIVGLAIPTVGWLGWIVLGGGGAAFVEMVREYLPLHVSLSRTHKTLEGSDTWIHLVWNTIQFGKSQIGAPSGWLIAACVGPLAALSATGAAKLASRERRLVLLFCALAPAYCLYVILAGQFWDYHWMPFRYFTALLASLCLGNFLAGQPTALRWHPLAALVLTFLVVLPIHSTTFVQWNGGAPPPPDEGRVDAISHFLEERLEPGDTVQPFDWARGGVHAALQARAPMATPFVSDYHFYHHVEDELVLELRRRFVEDLEAAPPRFLIDIVDRPMPSGAGTSREFPALERFVQDGYDVALEGPGWIVWERR